MRFFVDLPGGESTRRSILVSSNSLGLVPGGNGHVVSRLSPKPNGKQRRGHITGLAQSPPKVKRAKSVLRRVPTIDQEGRNNVVGGLMRRKKKGGDKEAGGGGGGGGGRLRRFGSSIRDKFRISVRGGTSTSSSSAVVANANAVVRNGGSVVMENGSNNGGSASVQAVTGGRNSIGGGGGGGRASSLTSSKPPARMLASFRT